MFYILIFLFGLCIGSFLNVLIERLPHEESIRGRSRCPKCNHDLSWRDLIPIFSFLILGGKCRYCGKKISFQYPIIEAITGLLFLLIVYENKVIFSTVYHFIDGHPQSGSLLFALYLFSITACLIVIFVSDFKYFIIPNQIIYALILITVAWILSINYFGLQNLFLCHSHESKNLINIINSGSRIECEMISWLNLLLSSIIAGGFFLSMILVSKGTWMGIGDAKMAFWMGLFLGWPKVFVALFLAFMAGGIIGIILILTGKKNLKSPIPFGTFLALATFVVMVFGERLLELAKWLNF